MFNSLGYKRYTVGKDSYDFLLDLYGHRTTQDLIEMADSRARSGPGPGWVVRARPDDIVVSLIRLDVECDEHPHTAYLIDEFVEHVRRHGGSMGIETPATVVKGVAKRFFDEFA